HVSDDVDVADMFHLQSVFLTCEPCMKGGEYGGEGPEGQSGLRLFFRKQQKLEVPQHSTRARRT
ncbi:MAG: hypothetical protein RLZZ253_2775, partial [Verrucomicrobiota bacterium]